MMYLTVRIIQTFNEDELKLIKSKTWKNGEWRCETDGIYNIVVEDTSDIGLNRKKFSWSDEHGDPIVFLTLDEEIKKIAHDDWHFSLSINKSDYAKILKRQEKLTNAFIN